MAWTVSRTPIHFPSKPVVLGESQHQAILLPQVPKQGKPNRVLGCGQAPSDLRGCHRPLSRTRPRSTLDHTLVTHKGTEEKRHRYFGDPSNGAMSGHYLHPHPIDYLSCAQVKN
jgi:hypothetical protein